MKHSMIWRSLLREIKGSLGRFLAIFAIVALGVGLFAGLKITQKDFIASTTKYYRENAFYDYRILGELGFSETQEKFFSELPEVAAAEGTFSFDAYYSQENGSQKVGRFHGITADVNKIILTGGRMPENENECLADAYVCGKGIIGKKILLGEENSESDLENFKTKEFQVVGIVKSPLYIQFERGNSSLGTGSIDAFFYLPKESFSSEAYTEIYVKFQPDFTIYSEEYKAWLDEKEPEWKEYLKQAGALRFEELPDLIKTAEGKLAKKRDEAWAELEDVRKELESARKEISDGEKELAEGRRELNQGWKDLEQAKKDLEDGKRTLEEKEPELEKGKKLLEEGKQKIEENEKLIAEKEAELSAGKTQLDAAEMTLKLGEMQYRLTLEGQISEQKEIDASKESLDERERSIATREAWAKTFGLEATYAEDFRKERESIAKERAELDKKLADLSKRYQENLALGSQLASGRKEYEDNLKKYEEGAKALREGKNAIIQGKKDLIESQKKIEQGESDLKEGRKKLKEAEKEIEEGEKTLSEKEVEYADGKRKFEEGKREYLNGFIKYESALEEFEEKISDAEEEIGKLKNRLEKGEEPEGYLLGRNTNVGYVCFESDSAIVDGIANVFPVFFFLVAALICVTTMNRMVEEQRTEIGVLKALGYSDGSIMFKYLFYSGSAALSGAVFGYVAGTHVFPFTIWKVYGIMYSAGDIVYEFDPVLAGISFIVSLLCSVGTTWLSCRKELSGNASTLMRPRAPKAGKRVFLEYVPFIWKRLSFLRKVAVRNVVRYKKRFFMMILGIGGCTALLLTGFGLKDSIAGVADVQYSEIQLMDLSVTLQKEISEEFLNKLKNLKSKGLGEWLVYQEGTLDLVSEKGQKNVTVLTFPKELTEEGLSSFLHLETRNGKKIKKPGTGEAVVTDKIAEILGIKAGDEIVLRNSNQKEYRVKVSGIARNHIFNFVFLDQTTWEGFGESYQPKSLYLKVAPGRDVSELAPRVMKLDGVAMVSVTRDMVKRFRTMMESMNLIVILVTSCAAGLAFIVLYNLTNINVTERIREIATIKVLGFFPSETALYVFRENIVLTVLGAFVGLGMGVWLHSFVIHEITVDMVSFGVRIFPVSYVYAVLLTILFSLLVSLMMNGRLEKISMTESLKSVD